MPIDIPIIGARTAIWIVAQLHLFFAAFVLGAPIFVVICEYLGVRTKDFRYERLAKEVMKVVVIAYGVTAIFGAMFAFLLMGPYQAFSNQLFKDFFPVFGVYGLLILLESLLMYTYYYTWDSLAQRKRIHISLGITLNIVGTLSMVLMNAVGSFMLTPPESMETASLWNMINNATWTGLNLHRFIANITFGGFIVALFAAFMFLTSKKKEDRAFYDWMGFIGNFIGVATLMALPIAGYIYAKELFLYDASISTLLMADKLSWFFEYQGILVVLLFLGANYYMWLSLQRITEGARFLGYMKATFVVIFVAGLIWIIPQNFLADLTSQAPAGVAMEELVIPVGAAFLGLMMAKGLAVTAIIIMTFISYLLYRRAMATGTVIWGHIDTKSQFVLIFLPTVAVFLMGLMGAIREMTRQDFHVFRVIQDVTPYWYMPTLGHTSLMSGIVTLIYFALMTIIFWIGFKMSKAE
jgi:cytochrome bd-type quinol oxidase subunit 1